MEGKYFSFSEGFAFSSLSWGKMEERKVEEFSINSILPGALLYSHLADRESILTYTLLSLLMGSADYRIGWDVLESQRQELVLYTGVGAMTFLYDGFLLSLSLKCGARYQYNITEKDGIFFSQDLTLATGVLYAGMGDDGLSVSFDGYIFSPLALYTDYFMGMKLGYSRRW